ncbi:MAG: group II intron reverse transcriptase/maturase [Actinomycetota bacterium]|nr:group II intron reverse transcriptase/maturase [Actinomycetota bacterium]
MGEVLEAVANPVNLAAAWAKVRANAGAAGVDGQSVAAFAADAEHQLGGLRRRLLSAERYVPPPVRRVEIPKPDGRIRPLGIPTVGDRVVQQAVVQVIGPVFDDRFTPSSFGYRPGRSARDAVGWVREGIRSGDRWVAEFDIVGFFDHLRHNRLLREVAKVIDDPEVIGLIRRWLRAGVLTDRGVEPRVAGTPQGGVISPLLANIYLHRLDMEVRAAGFRLIRYADDFVILADRRWKAQAADRLVRKILADIGLEVAEAKSGVVAVRDGFEFLGFQFHGRFLRPRPRALNRFKDEVRKRTRRLAPISLQVMIEQLNPVIRGWGHYYKVGDVTSLFVDLDKWIRMRLRSKVIRRHATTLSNRKMPNRVLRSMGLASLDDLRRAYLSPL